MKTRIAIDRPSGAAPGRLFGEDRLEISGWVGSVQPVRRIELRADDGDGGWTRAVYGLPRPDVGDAFPHFANKDRTGFQAFVQIGPNTRKIEMRVQAVSEDAEPAELKAETSIPVDVEQLRRIELDESTDDLDRDCDWCGYTGGLRRESTERGPFHLVTCPNCGFGMAKPLPYASSLAVLYETEYWNHAPLGPEGLGPSGDSQYIADLFARYGNGGKRSLEVGCGQGTLLLGLHELGYEVSGQDLSQNAACALQERIGATIWRQPLAEVTEDPTFDCIVTRHVLEHTVTPRADIEWMRDHLAPGGALVVLVPNWASCAAKLLDESWEWFVPPIHVGYFTPQSMIEGARQLGLTLAEMTTREGDGAPLVDSLRTQRNYRADDLPAWQATAWSRVLEHDDGKALDERLRTPLPITDDGQELIAVFTKPSN